jgi:CBS domain-containing protein
MSFGAVVPFFGTGFGSGLWLAFIGWFLASAAAQSLRRLLVDEALAGLTVMDLMRRSSVVFPGEATVGDIVHEGFMRTDERAFPVAEDGRLVGLVSVDDVRATPQSAWGTTELHSIMTPVEKLGGIAPTEAVTEALARMTRLGVDQLPVLRNGELVGILHQRDIARWLELRSGHTGPGHTPPPPSRQALAH